MENLSISEIVLATKGKIIKKGSAEFFSSISTDTRTIKNGDVFIALNGENFNGNKYIKEAILSGASLCIIDDISFYKNLSSKDNDCYVIEVSDGKEALKSLAAYYIDKLKIKVIGVTGSTGKTSTKDLMAAALSYKYKVFKTKGNFNNDIGMPLMILSMDSSYDIAVLEMGMSNLGEIHTLASIAKPNIAVITNIGVSHLENLKTRENIFKAKMEITDYFTEDGFLVLNGDSDYLNLAKSNKCLINKVGINNDNGEFIYNVTNIINDKAFVEFTIIDKKSKEHGTFKILTPGIHNVLNAQLAICVSRRLGLTFEEIQKGFNNIESTSMRLQLIENDNRIIVNDSYNSSPDSVIAGIEYLKVFKGNRNIAILGTMRELGEDSFKLHKKISSYAKANNINLLLVISEFSQAFNEGFGDEGFKVFSTKEELADYYNSIKCHGDVVLVKASRTMEFEKIVNLIK